MKTKNIYVPLWLTYGQYFSSYTDEQVGRLARAMMAYRETGVEPEFEGDEKYIWPAIRRDIDNLTRTIKERTRRNTINGAKGGRPKMSEEPKESERFSEKAKKPNENENVSETETETVNEIVSETVSEKEMENETGNETEREKKEKEMDSSPKTAAAACLPAPPAQDPQGQAEGGPASFGKSIAVLSEYFEENCGQKRTSVLAKAFRKSLLDGASEALVRAAIDDTAASVPDKPARYLCKLLENLREEKVRDIEGFRSRKEAFRQRKAAASPGLKRDQLFDYSGEEGSL